MCISKEVSLVAFFTSLATSVYLFQRNNQNDRWAALTFGYIGFMQILEVMMWIDQKCSGLNQKATSLAFWHNVLQPVVSLGVAYYFTKGKISSYLYLILAAYLLYSLPKIYNAKKENQCSLPCKGSTVGLSWPYTYTDNYLSNQIVWIVFAIALASPFLAMKKDKYIYFSLVLITFMMGHFISTKRCPEDELNKSNPTSGSWWCLIGAFAPLVSVYINK